MIRRVNLLLLLTGLVALGCESNQAPPPASSDADADTDTDSDADNDTDTDTDGDADNDTDTDGDTDTDTDGDADADSDSDADGDADADSDSDADGDADTGEEECADFPWQVEVKPINMLVLLDRSASMANNNIGDKTYAQVVKEAVDAIVERHTNSGIINFALNVFPSPKMCTDEYRLENESGGAAEIVCQAASQFTSVGNPYRPPEVPFADDISIDTYDAIHTVLEEVGNCGGTPISKSLLWARDYLNDLELEDDTYILLATDGAPSCNLNAELPCDSAMPGQTAEIPAHCLDDMDSVHAIFDLAKDGYKTFLVGVGDDVTAFSSLMDVIAYVGGGLLKPDQTDLYDIEPHPEDGTYFYPAADAETLSAALEDVTNEAISCEFDVDWDSIPDQDPTTNKVVFKSCSQMRVFGIPEDGGEKIELTYMEHCRDEDPESSDERRRMGWTWEELEGTSWDGITAIGTDVSRCGRVKLCNSACSKLKTIRGAKEWNEVSASFGCKPVIVV